jgi:hypothetical protein
MACTCASLIILLVELFQSLFVNRHGQAIDLLVKTGGSICGAVCAGFCPTRVTEQLDRVWWHIQRSKVPLLIALLWAGFPGLAFAMQYPWFSFRNWESHFSFQIGNEATGEKPWLGKIYRVALYNRVLAAEEIARHFQSATASGAMAHSAEQGLVALYMFRESTGNTAHDSSGFGSPLNLTFFPESHVQWLADSNGIEILQPAIVKSPGPATKLFTALTGVSALSVEAWIQPANVTQTGSARIISFSEDWRTRNFMLAQTEADLVFRVRTPFTGRDGGGVHLHTEDHFLTTERMHLVATYKDGVERLYVNGTEHLYSIDLATEGMIGFAVKRSPIAKIAYSFFYFLPLACLSAVVISTQGQGVTATLILSMAIGTSLLSITEIFQAIAFARSLDLPLLGYGTLTGMIGALSGIAFTTRRSEVPAPKRHRGKEERCSM